METTISKWWDIRADNGDLLACIKALSLADAIARYEGRAVQYTQAELDQENYQTMALHHWQGQNGRRN